jgi:hypothetical protein
LATDNRETREGDDGNSGFGQQFSGNGIRVGMFVHDPFDARTDEELGAIDARLMRAIGGGMLETDAV